MALDKGKPHANFMPSTLLEARIKAINRVGYVLGRFGLNCLPKAMALKHWMRAYAPLQLHLGVQKAKNGAFEAHAWVTYNNKIIMGEDPNNNYVPIAEW